MYMSKKTKIQKEIKLKIGIVASILTLGWLAYCITFFIFYKNAYFYVDKRLSLFLRLLSFLNNNWIETILFFLGALLLFTSSFFLIGGMYFLYKEGILTKKVIYTGLVLVGVLCVILCLTIMWSIFIVLLILSVSIVYISFILAGKGLKEDEGEEILAILGPFEREGEAKKAGQLFLKEQAGHDLSSLQTEIYQEKDNDYYVEIYIDADTTIESDKRSYRKIDEI